MKVTIKADCDRILLRKEHEAFSDNRRGWLSLCVFLSDDKKIIVSDKPFNGAIKVVLRDAEKHGEQDPDYNCPTAHDNVETNLYGSLVRVCKEGIKEYGFRNRRTFYVKKMSL